MSSKSTTREHLQFIQAVDVVPYVVMGGIILMLCCCMGGVVLLYGRCCGVVWAVLSRNNDGD